MVGRRKIRLKAQLRAQKVFKKNMKIKTNKFIERNKYEEICKVHTTGQIEECGLKSLGMKIFLLLCQKFHVPIFF